LARFVAAFIEGAQSEGVIATAKHFPGHGDTATDSHLGVAQVTGNLARLQSVELQPFRKAIEAGVDSVMIAHVSVPSLEPDPKRVATTSPAIVNDLLKTQLGFKGLVVTDALDMAGLTRLYAANIGRAAVQEGDMDRARTVLDKALALSPDLARAHFFYAKVMRADGNYEGAADHLRKVLTQYPRDRVALNDLGRILFLQRKYSEAVKVLESVLAIDPEDLQAHYNLMLCYNGLGDETKAKEHQARYLRFKADEAAQAITGPYRQLNPEDNNERQAIHEHVSVPLEVSKTGRSAEQSSARVRSAASLGASR